MKMNILKKILHELTEINRKLQTIASSLECEKTASCWELPHGTADLNINARPQNKTSLQD